MFDAFFFYFRMSTNCPILYYLPGDETVKFFNISLKENEKPSLKHLKQYFPENGNFKFYKRIRIGNREVEQLMIHDDELIGDDPNHPNELTVWAKPNESSSGKLISLLSLVFCKYGMDSIISNYEAYSL